MPLDSLGVKIPGTHNGGKGELDVASNGDLFFVVWSDGRNGNFDIFGCRVDSSGTPMDSSGFPIAEVLGVQDDPRVVFDGATFFVLWEDQRDGTHDVYGARVTTGGVVLDTNGVLLASGDNYDKYPCVSPAYDRGEVLVTYSRRLPIPNWTDRIYGRFYQPVLYGDANGDGEITMMDLGYLVEYLFLVGPEPLPLLAGDANGDGAVTVVDVTWLRNFLR